MNHKREQLIRMLEGNPEGFTRYTLAERLNLTDRQARLLISELTTSATLPIICDRDDLGDGLYRIAQAHEHDRVNRECGEDASRAITLHARAKGRRLAFERRYQAGSLFLDPVPELEAIT